MVVNKNREPEPSPSSTPGEVEVLAEMQLTGILIQKPTAGGLEETICVIV
jgi:hypothetical protein